MASLDCCLLAPGEGVCVRSRQMVPGEGTVPYTSADACAPDSCTDECLARPTCVGVTPDHLLLDLLPPVRAATQRAVAAWVPCGQAGQAPCTPGQVTLHFAPVVRGSAWLCAGAHGADARVPAPECHLVLPGDTNATLLVQPTVRHCVSVAMRAPRLGAAPAGPVVGALMALLPIVLVPLGACLGR